MKKSKRQMLLASVFVLVLLLVVYFFLDFSNRKKDTETETETQGEQVIAVQTDELSHISIENESGTIYFTKKDNNWVYEEDENFPLDEDVFDNLVSTLQEISAVRTLENAGDLKEYGLEEPAVTVTAETKDGTKRELYIGNQNTSTGDYYARTGVRDMVYTIDGTTAGAFACTLYDLAQASNFPTISSTKLTGIKVEKGGESISLAKAEEDGSYSWTVAANGQKSKGDSDKMSELAGVADSLIYASYINYNAEDLSEYGLKEPEAVITVDYTQTQEADTEEETEAIEIPEQVVLEVGDKDVDGNYYVKLQGSTEVHTMSAETLDTWLNVTYEDCLDTYVSYVPLSGISELRVTLDGVTHLLTVEEETAGETEDEVQYKYYMDDQEVDSEAFNQFYNASYQMRAQSRLEEEPKSAEEAQLVLEFVKKDGSSLKVEYSVYEDGFYLAKTAGDKPGLVSRLDVQSLIDKFNKM